MEEEICIREINENIRRVYAKEELTKPLKELNTSCKFREEYDKFCLIQEGVPSDIKAHRKAYGKAYQQRPKYKAQQKAYRQRPEVKAHKKAQQKAYRQRPEVKAHIKAHKKAYYQRKKLRG